MMGIPYEPRQDVPVVTKEHRAAIERAQSWPDLRAAGRTIWTYAVGSIERDALCSAVAQRTAELQHRRWFRT